MAILPRLSPTHLTVYLAVNLTIDLISPINLTCPNLTCSDLPCPDLPCPELVLTCPEPALP